MNETLSHLIQRLVDILSRHVREEDEILSDDAFIRSVFSQYEKSREDYIIDVNE